MHPAPRASLRKVPAGASSKRSSSPQTQPPAKPSSSKISLHLKTSGANHRPPKDSPAADIESPTSRRAGRSSKVSVSPRKKRSESMESDSSLTSLTSNEEEEVQVTSTKSHAGNASKTACSNVDASASKDHAAERGSLAAPDRSLKRPSADTDPLEEERDRTFAAKKQKLDENITRDYSFEESSVRQPHEESTTRTRLQRARIEMPVPTQFALPLGEDHSSKRRSSRSISDGFRSPLSSPRSSRRATPQPTKQPPRLSAKRAKTKRS